MKNSGKIIVGALALISTAATPVFSADLVVTSFSAYAGQTNIVLQAHDNVTFTGGQLVLPDLPPGASLGQLVVQAGNNIVVNDDTSIVAGPNWSINLVSGTEVPAGTMPNHVSDGTQSDGVYLLGGSFLATQNGNISVTAANEVQINALADTAGDNGIRTLAGGNIDVTALHGDVNTGANNLGYTFNKRTAPFYAVSSAAGGISTVAGGNVTIAAGQNVTSYLPYGSDTGDAGTGAFGPQGGNVTITAGDNVYGHYVVANGVGSITATNGDIGAPDGLLKFALSLVGGSWSAQAPQGNIYLQEVRNPNGVLNDLAKSGSDLAGSHLFDYAPNAAVNLNAGSGVYLTALGLPRPNDAVQVMYPPELSVTAGSGGVNVGGTVTLFPSPAQNLGITTTGGGTLCSHPILNVPYELLMSDSAQTQWTSPASFSDSDHGALANEPTDPTPVIINISGNLENLELITTKETQITVGGDMISCGFSGQNLHANDVSSIEVTGRIFDQSAYTFVNGVAVPNVPADPSPADGESGFRLGGPGQFNLHAGSISLGSAYGILSCGVADPQGGFSRYSNLAPITSAGAALNVTVSTNLDLETSTIAAIGGGNVSVTSGGGMDLGFPVLFNTTRQVGCGILSSGGGNVTAQAAGDIDINGSRIATYNGGNVFIESLTGNVNAGSGGTNYNGVGVSYVHPGTGAAGYYTEEVYGSGIMATTLVNPSQVPGGATAPGNITVETPHGNILTTSAGILQEKLGGPIPPGPTITLTAGSTGLPGSVGNIFLGNAGVIGGQLNATATGKITGLSTGQPIVNFIGFYPDTTVVYGSTNPLTASVYTGTPIFSTSPTNIAIITQKTNLVVKGVGGFTVTVRVPQMTNGIFIFTSNSLSLPFASAPAPLTITANNTNRVFGQPNPAFTASYSGLVNGDKFANVFTGPPALVTTAASSSLPGNNYTITTNHASWPFKPGATNYWVTFVPGTLTVYPRTNSQSVQFTALRNPTNLVYGTNLALTASSSLPGAVVTFAVTRSSPTNLASVDISNNLLVKGVGTFTVTATAPAVANHGTGTNYSSASSSLNFTADKARLTVTDNASRTQGSTNTVFTPPIYSGFVNGDDSNMVSGNLKGTVTNKATSSTPAGTYPGYVYVSGGTLSATNYTFEFVPGTLTISPPALTLASLAAFLGTNLLDGNELRHILTNNYAHPARMDPVTLADFLGSTNLNSVDTNDLNVFMNYFPPSGNVLPVALAKLLGAPGNIVDPAGLNVVLAHYTNWPSAPNFTSLPPYLTANGNVKTNYCFTITNFNFKVQFSTDLSHWTNLDRPGQILFTDTNAPAEPSGFYRLLNSRGN